MVTQWQNIVFFILPRCYIDTGEGGGDRSRGSNQLQRGGVGGEGVKSDQNQDEEKRGMLSNLYYGTTCVTNMAKIVIAFP